MAQKINIVLVDDLDGGEADETVTFALDGTSYEIDLNAKNADKLRGVLYDYTDKARKVTGGRGKASRPRTASAGSDAKQVRAWAKDNGLDVPERGRIPAEVRERYEAAN